MIITLNLTKKYGLTGYGKEGDEFNPDEHEAIGRMEDEKAKKETLAQVYLKGYKLKDKVIKGTEEDPDGGAYPDDIEKYMLDTYKYVSDNLYYIETLLHQFILQGGISEGTFKTSDKDMIWKKVS